jgi:hypothetical protein
MAKAEQAELIITFHNTHEAIMGERILLDSGIDVRVMPMPVTLGPACGMALRVGPADLERISVLLGKTITGVYQADETKRVFVPWKP